MLCMLIVLHTIASYTDCVSMGAVAPRICLTNVKFLPQALCIIHKLCMQVLHNAAVLGMNVCTYVHTIILMMFFSFTAVTK